MDSGLVKAESAVNGILIGTAIVFFVLLIRSFGNEKFRVMFWTALGRMMLPKWIMGCFFKRVQFYHRYKVTKLRWNSFFGIWSVQWFWLGLATVDLIRPVFLIDLFSPEWYPFFVDSESFSLKMFFPVISFILSNVVLNGVYDRLFPNRHFDKAMLAFLELNKVFSSDDERKPKIKLRGNLATIDFYGISISAEKFNSLMPSFETFSGGRINAVIPNPNKPNIFQVKFTFDEWPEEIPYTDDVPIESDTFWPIGTDMIGQVGIDTDNTPHVLLAGKTGAGKTVTLLNIISSAVRANPNTIPIIMDLSAKSGQDFLDIFDDPSDEHEGEPSNIYLVIDREQTKKVIQFVHWEMEERRNKYALTRAREGRPAKLSHYNQITGAELPSILLICDEIISSQIMPTRGNGEKEINDWHETQRKFADIARLGRSYGIHLVISILTARFDFLGEIRRQFEAISLYQSQNEVEITLGKRFAIPADPKGFIALSTGGYNDSLGLAKGYMNNPLQTGRYVRLAEQNLSDATKDTLAVLDKMIERYSVNDMKSIAQTGNRINIESPIWKKEAHDEKKF